MEPLRTLSAPSFRSRSPLLPRWPPGGNPSRSGRENAPIIHPNIQIDCPPSPSLLKKPPAPLPLPPSTEISARSNPLSDRSSDPSVKVVVRMRPANFHQGGEDLIAHKVSSDSLSVGDRTFTFNSILGSEATQDDVFNLVGVPLVKNSLAGFNTSIVSYGQTGSGKTYTMWGPPSAMVDCRSVNSSLGIVPRIFQMLFSEISREQDGSRDHQANYQCRCSFLEVYNNQITDLLDPTQRNLQIRDDATNGLHVENLTDQYVSTVEDVTQLLVKGLSSRKVGTTSINSKSSRSHVLFTCVVESWYKGSSSKCFGSSKTSRISFFDLAGSDTDKPDHVGRQCVKEERHVKKSLSKLGRLVNILAEAKHLGKDQKIPYDSCLTHLLQETLGGNTKATFICTIFSNARYKAGTLSTLRFGERVVRIQNKAVINEITEDDVNGLSDQIRQLKEELIRAKSFGGGSVDTIGGYFRGRNARDNLNLLRVSLNRSLILPPIDNDSEDEMDVDEGDVRELCVQLANIDPASEDISDNIVEDNDAAFFLPSNASTQVIVDSRTEPSDVHSQTSEPEDLCNSSTLPICSDLVCSDVSENDRELKNSFSKSSLSLVPSPPSDNPTLCESPKISTKWRKSLISSQSGDEYLSDSQVFAKHDLIRSSLQSSKVCPTESLAASLHRGLQIIDFHQRVQPVNKSFIGLSFEHLTSVTRQSVNKVDAGIQTLAHDAGSFLCSSCRKVCASDNKPGCENSELQIVPVNDAGTPEILQKQVFKAQSIHELEQSSDADQNQQPEVLRLDNVASTTKDLKNDEGTERTVGHVKANHFDSNEKEALLEEIQCLRNQLKSYTKANHFDSNEKEALLEEIQCLRNQLKSYTKASHFDSNEKEALLEEIQSLRNQLKSYTIESTDDASLLEMIRNGSSVEKKEEDIDKERQRWTESESRWISLAEELRIDLESNRRIAEKKEMELDMEKKCTAELDDALKRSILGHAKIIEHFTELQEKHESLLWSHRKVMEGIAEVKKAAAKAGGKRAGSAFVSALAAELSTLRVEREKERTYLKEQNKGLRTQLRDTAEAVHAAGELLVRLREAEEAVSVTEEKYEQAEQEKEKLKKQMEKMKRKHAMEMVTVKRCIAESRLPESALEPFYLNDHPVGAEDNKMRLPDDEQSWRSAFKPSYQ